MRLQSIYGLFPRILGKGDAAKVKENAIIQRQTVSYSSEMG